MAVQSLSSLSIQELEQTVDAYPWFAAARRELFLRQVRSGGKDAAEAAAEAALYVPSRAMLWRAAFPRKAEEAPAAPAAPTRQPRPRYILAGGDYFSRRDFEDLEKSGEAFSFSRIQLSDVEEADAPAGQKPAATADKAAESAKETVVCTETMARIYERQGHFDRAIEVYKKLILLYPEKSAYFAALIDKIETKIKNI